MTDTVAPQKSLLVRNPNFRALWLSGTVGVLGTAVTSIAFPVIAVVELQASDFAVAALAGMTFLPWLLLGLPVGVWVDRWARKPVIIWSLVGRIMVLATIPVTFWLGVMSVAQLFVVSFLVGLSAVFFTLADQALIPQAVSKDELVEGNGLMTASSASADAAGRGVAGWLTVAIGASNSLLVQIGTSLASLFAISSLKLKEAEPHQGERRIFREMKDGLRYTFSTGPLRAILFNAALWNLGGSMVASLLVLLVLRTLNESEIWLGALMAAASVGGALGGITVKRATDRFGSGPVWRYAMIPGVLGYASLLIMTPGYGMLWGVLGMFVMGVAIAWNIVVGSAFRQRVCPPTMMGRLGAASRMVSWGMLGVASILGGVLAELGGIRMAVIIGVVLMVGAPLVALFGPLRHVERLEDLEPEQEPDPAPKHP
ncbi:MFS transporter [Arthrobacter sp. HLT1-21]